MLFNIFIFLEVCSAVGCAANNGSYASQKIYMLSWRDRKSMTLLMVMDYRIVDAFSFWAIAFYVS